MNLNAIPLVALPWRKPGDPTFARNADVDPACPVWRKYRPIDPLPAKIVSFDDPISVSLEIVTLERHLFAVGRQTPQAVYVAADDEPARDQLVLMLAGLVLVDQIFEALHGRCGGCGGLYEHREEWCRVRMREVEQDLWSVRHAWPSARR